MEKHIFEEVKEQAEDVYYKKRREIRDKYEEKLSEIRDDTILKILMGTKDLYSLVEYREFIDENKDRHLVFSKEFGDKVDKLISKEQKPIREEMDKDFEKLKTKHRNWIVNLLCKARKEVPSLPIY